MLLLEVPVPLVALIAPALVLVTVAWLAAQGLRSLQSALTEERLKSTAQFALAPSTPRFAPAEIRLLRHLAKQADEASLQRIVYEVTEQGWTEPQIKAAFKSLGEKKLATGRLVEFEW